MDRPDSDAAGDVAADRADGNRPDGSDAGDAPDARPTDNLLRGVTAIAAGARHACAMTRAGAVYCWGANAVGQLGDGTLDGRPWAREALALGDDVHAMAIGGFHDCVIAGENNALRCIGANDSGQTIGGSPAIRLEPILYGEDIDEVVTGAKHTCIRSGGNVQCFGANNFLQLGRSGGDSKMPAPVVGAASDIVQLAAGDAHTCARRANGTLQCWGGNFAAQLGFGPPTAAREPIAPMDFYDVLEPSVAIATGSAHTCSLDVEHNLVCWGDDSGYQLGVEGTYYPYAALMREGLDGVALGGLHSCGLTDGHVTCWGTNGYGQTGEGEPIRSAESNPIEIEGVTALAAGPDFNCALLTDTTVRCWGHNDFGQLGDGTLNDRAIPTAVIVRER